MSEIYPNPDQPRKTFKSKSLEELAKSIKENGLIQPITVVERTGYMIVSGKRRFRAVQLLGKEEINAVIIEATDSKIAALSLIENVQREDMNAIEIAAAYFELVKAGFSVEEISGTIGKSTQSIKFYLCLNKLDPVLMEATRKEIINVHTAWELARLDEADDQIIIYKKIVSSQLKAAEAGSFITAFINSKNQLTIPVKANENWKVEKNLKGELESAIGAADKTVNNIFDKLAKNKNLRIDTVVVQELGLLAKSITRLQNKLETNNRNAELLNDLGKVA